MMPDLISEQPKASGTMHAQPPTSNSPTQPKTKQETVEGSGGKNNQKFRGFHYQGPDFNDTVSRRSYASDVLMQS
ncbi:hypothetical protein Ac2012v2_006197 [Leucoagaricus gongylophorus]